MLSNKFCCQVNPEIMIAGIYGNHEIKIMWISINHGNPEIK